MLKKNHLYKWWQFWKYWEVVNKYIGLLYEYREEQYKHGELIGFTEQLLTEVISGNGLSGRTLAEMDELFPENKFPGIRM